MQQKDNQKDNKKSIKDVLYSTLESLKNSRLVRYISFPVVGSQILKYLGFFDLMVYYISWVHSFVGVENYPQNPKMLESILGLHLYLMLINWSSISEIHYRLIATGYSQLVYVNMPYLLPTLGSYTLRLIFQLNLFIISVTLCKKIIEKIISEKIKQILNENSSSQVTATFVDSSEYANKHAKLKQKYQDVSNHEKRKK